MNRLWQGDRSSYSRSQIFPAGKNGKKPKKNIDTDGKLEEDKLRTKNLVEDIFADRRISDNPENALQDVFFLATCHPSIKAGLVDTENLPISNDGIAVPSHTSYYGHIPPALPIVPARTLPGNSGATLTLMQTRDGTVPKIHGISGIRYICSATGFVCHDIGLSSKTCVRFLPTITYRPT